MSDEVSSCAIHFFADAFEAVDVVVDKLPTEPRGE